MPSSPRAPRPGTRGDGPATPATVALDRLRVSYTRHPYQHDLGSGSYGLEAAAQLGMPPHQVFKTLLVATPAGLAVAVVPVDRQLDLKAVAAALGVKSATMADPREAERATGYVVGGISPVGQRRSLPTVLDETALGLETVFVSGGRRGFDLGLSPADLVAATRARTAPIAQRP